jgi:hypothetical protein
MTPRLYEIPDMFIVWAKEDQVRWQDAVLNWRLMQPATTNKQQELNRNVRLVGLLSDIKDSDMRRRWLQGFVRALLAPKKAGRKRAEQDEQFARRDHKIFCALEEIREAHLVSKDEAIDYLLKDRQQYGFGPEDNLPATNKGIEEADKRARRRSGQIRRPVPRRGKTAAGHAT